MLPAHGLRFVETPQEEEVLVEAAPSDAQSAAQHRYLWVVGQDTVPYALEDCDFGRSLETGVVKHTNLTGGDLAHCGGEAWFVNDDVVIINGRSGRYGPKNECELRAAGLAFKGCGYRVGMIGFDETGVPAAVVVGEEDVEWL